MSVSISNATGANGLGCDSRIQRNPFASDSCSAALVVLAKRGVVEEPDASTSRDTRPSFEMRTRRDEVRPVETLVARPHPSSRSPKTGGAGGWRHAAP